MIAAKEKYRVDSNQEFIGLGLANFIGSFSCLTRSPADFPAPQSITRGGLGPGWPR